MTDGGANPNGAWTWDNWIKALPPLATNNFTVMADSVFRVDPSFMGQLYFTSTLDLTVGWYFTAPASKTITRKRGSCNGKYTQWMRVNFGNFGLMW
jgi:hypothetical protein